MLEVCYNRVTAGLVSRRPERRSDWMIVGVTGTQGGLTEKQFEALGALFRSTRVDGLHHGDCIGADAQVHEAAMDRGIQVIVHPPSNGSKRAYVKGATITNPPFEYLVRNRHIVEAAEI